MRVTVNVKAMEERLAARHSSGWTYIMSERGLTELRSYSGIEDQCRLGMGRVVLDRPIDLDKATEHDVRQLALVRDLTSCLVPVEWRLHCSDGAKIQELVCFQPPRSVSGAFCDLDTWTREFRYGLLYWRAGPDFVVIRDTRQESVNVVTLNVGPYLDAFKVCSEGSRCNLVDTDALRLFVSDHLILELDEWRLSLPYRMRRWPIPCNAI